jgi:hypothetical protein
MGEFDTDIVTFEEAFFAEGKQNSHTTQMSELAAT